MEDIDRCCCGELCVLVDGGLVADGEAVVVAACVENRRGACDIDWGMTSRGDETEDRGSLAEFREVEEERVETERLGRRIACANRDLVFLIVVLFY